MILILLADEPQRLMRSAQHMPLLEPHGEQPVHGSQHRGTRADGQPSRNFLAHRAPRFQPVRGEDGQSDPVIDDGGDCAFVTICAGTFGSRYPLLRPTNIASCSRPCGHK
jgi:hypothetical protein